MELTRIATDPVTIKDVEALGIHRFEADASQIGWAPGEPRAEINTNLGNGQPFVLDRCDHYYGQWTSAKYTQMFGCVTLRVYNT